MGLQQVSECSQIITYFEKIAGNLGSHFLQPSQPIDLQSIVIYGCTVYFLSPNKDIKMIFCTVIQPPSPCQYRHTHYIKGIPKESLRGPEIQEFNNKEGVLQGVKGLGRAVFLYFLRSILVFTAFPCQGNSDMQRGSSSHFRPPPSYVHALNRTICTVTLFLMDPPPSLTRTIFETCTPSNCKQKTICTVTCSL